MKSVTYEGFSRNSSGVVLYYMVNESTCIFTGVTSSVVSTSTINAAKEIITAITREEIALTPLIRFFDLQTCRGYQKDQGRFDFDEVIYQIVRGRIENISWKPTPCPSAILEKFQRWVGYPPIQTNNPCESVLS